MLAFASAGSGQDLQIYSAHLQSGSVEQKREALFQIRNLRSEAASRAALPALKDKSEIVRATAASSVVFIPPDEAAAALIPLLSDKAEFVRREAAYALGTAGSSVGTAALLNMLRRDKVLENRAAAAEALGKIGDVSAVEPLLSILGSRPVEDEEFIRRAAARSVGNIAQIIQTGRSRVVTPKNFLPDRLKGFESPKHPNLTAEFPVFQRAIAVLADTLRNARESDDTRREAAFSLGAIGDEAALPVLRSDINGGDPYLAEIVEEAVSKIGIATEARGK